MLFLRHIEIWGNIIFSFTGLLGILSKGMNAEINEVVTMIDNPVIGKKYWLYKEKRNLTMAEKTCEENGQELVQLPTRSEHEWVKQNLADFHSYWVGAIVVGDKMYWKVPNGKILIEMNRYFYPIFSEGKFSVAHEDHLHWSENTNQNFIICQKDYSEKKGNFEMLDGKHHFQSKINQFRGGKFQCASKCMMSLECKVFLLDFLKGNCQLYSGFTESSPQEDGIDCNSSSIGCFARL